MKKIINIYKKDEEYIHKYILAILETMPREYTNNAQTIFKRYKYIELVYSVDRNFKQNTPTIHRDKVVNENLNSDKSRYFKNINIEKDGHYISNPYIHYSTGKPSVSVVHRVDNTYYVFDVSLIPLLEELQLIDYNSMYQRYIKAVYLLGATILSVIALSLLGYGVYGLLTLMFSLQASNFLHDIFKSIIAVTIGLAMFDLAKQIFEHEVLFRSFHREEDQQFKVLGNFLISIIIALSIETLLVVFKVVLDDYTQMLSAFYLLLGTTIMFVGLAYFHKSIGAHKTTDE